MSYAPRKISSVLITYPHCDISKEMLMELVKTHKKFEGKIKYVVACTEKHKDGTEHKHVLVMLLEPIYISRVDCEAAWDLFKEWRITNDGELMEGSMHWKWLKDHFRVDYIDDYPACGKDIKDEGLENCFYRRFHCNIEGVRSPKGSIDYVKKDGDWIEFGKGPEKKLTKKEKNELLMEKPLIDLVHDGDISIYHVNQLKRARDTLLDELQQEFYGVKKVHWYWGPTGTGKTREAWKQAIEEYAKDQPDPQRTIWISSSNGQWFDGYNGQPAVILDDVRANSWDFAEMLRLLDRYPLRVPVKGGFRRWVPREVWITAPAAPRDIYKNYTTGEPYEGIEQLERRCSEIREFTAESVEDEPDPRDTFQDQECKTQWD